MATVLSKEDNRVIWFNGLWSNDESLDLTMAGNTPLPAPTPKISSTDISGADGTIDTSWGSGYIRFNSLTISYVFTHAISRYSPLNNDSLHEVTNEFGPRRPLNEMNRLMKQHVSKVENWIFKPKKFTPDGTGVVIANKWELQGRLYDTGICDPETETGHYLFNARCTNFSVGKVVSAEQWLIQYSIEITADPYMYEYSANPETYTMFSGPSDDAVGMAETTVRVFTLNDSEETPTRYLWTNDNIIDLETTSVNEINSDILEVTFDFRPSTVPIYYGKIGVYMNRFMICNYNGNTYHYRVENIEVTSGDCTFIESNKLATPQEFAYTDHNGYSIRCRLITDYDSSGSTASVGQLNSESSGKIPISFIWGTIKKFQLPKNTDFAVSGQVKDITHFNQVTGASPDTIYSISRYFGEPFQFDDDPYNELIMPTKNYGFYKIVSPDNYRRTI